MKRESKRLLIVLGITLCILTLGYSVVLQKAGYLTYLNSDMASEVILARQQAEHGHVVEMDWLYSTEIHTLHMNLLYALSFLFTDSYFAARVIGNTIGFILGMASHVYLCRKLRLSYGIALCTAALLPLASSVLYAANMTIGGYYIVHLSFAYLGAGLWLDSAQRARRRGKGLLLAFAFLMFCALEGFLSVRYVLCFICPMLVAAVFDYIFAPEQVHELRDRHDRFFGMTVLGFVSCVAGYVLSEIIYPHVFTSGTGSAASFVFNPLDGPSMMETIMVVFADFLKLLGWRGGVTLFSAAGIVNICVAAMIVLGAMLCVRVYRGLSEKDEASCAQKCMLRYAAYAFLVNLFCFVFVQGTYLNRYLLVAVLFFIPALAVALQRERNKRLMVLFCTVLCMGLGVSSLLLLRETIDSERAAKDRGQDMMDAAQYLIAEGYTHGYGDFWDVRVMQERTNGALTFAALSVTETEDMASVPKTLSFARWLEVDDASDLDACEGKTFLLMQRSREAELGEWLEVCGAPVIYENDTYRIYGYDSSAALAMDMREGGMTLEQAQRQEDGSYLLHSGGRLRMPLDWREAGTYTFSLNVEGKPQSDSVVRLYSGRGFDVIAEQQLTAGDNYVSFSLEHDDKYFMIQIHSGSSDELRVEDLALKKVH